MDRHHDNLSPILGGTQVEDGVQRSGRIGGTEIHIAYTKTIAHKLGFAREATELNGFTEEREQDGSVETVVAICRCLLTTTINAIENANQGSIGNSGGTSWAIGE